MDAKRNPAGAESVIVSGYENCCWAVLHLFFMVAYAKLLITMTRPLKLTSSLRDCIVEALMADMAAGRWPAGKRMPSLRALAKRFTTSQAPVNDAIAILEAKGYVERRQGAGTYILAVPEAARTADTAMLLTVTHGHVFAPLTRLLVRRLHDQDLILTTLDIAHGNAGSLVRRAAFSGARFLIIHGGGHFRFQELPPAALNRKHLIAVVNWESNAMLDHVHSFIVDQAAGSRTVAEHLWAAGHRHVLVTAPSNMLGDAGLWDGKGPCPCVLNKQGAGFEPIWRRRGGRVTRLVCTPDNKDAPPCDEAALLGIVSAAAAPTAIVGLRDTDAWHVRETLRRIRPEALDRLSFTGNGNTPWSRASHPPFTTLDWNLEEIVNPACDLIRDIQAGRIPETPVKHLVAPRLILR